MTHRVAQLLLETGDAPGALKFFRSARDSAVKVHGTDHQVTQTIAVNLRFAEDAVSKARGSESDTGNDADPDTDTDSDTETEASTETDTDTDTDDKS